MADTTLSALFPAVPEVVGGERVEVRPVIVSELRLVERVLEGWAILIASGGETVSPESWDAFLSLVSSACGKPREWVVALPEEEFERLTCLVLALNRDIWDTPTSTDDQEPFTWAQIVQRLVKAGHPWDAVQGMTLGQVQAFLKEALRIEREELALDITAASFSMADGKAVAQATKELRRG